MSYLSFKIMKFKTLTIRIDKHSSNALDTIKFLESHPKVEKVFYPGLEAHLQFKVAREQVSGF